MPFKSAKQERWMWANEPEMAQRWFNEHGHAPGFKKGRKKMKKSFQMRVLGEEGGLVLMKAETEGLKRWRRKQRRGAIMKPETFAGIEAAARKKHGAERAKKIAGAAYWRAARAKHDEAVKSTLTTTGGDLYIVLRKAACDKGRFPAKDVGHGYGASGRKPGMRKENMRGWRGKPKNRNRPPRSSALKSAQGPEVIELVKAKKVYVKPHSAAGHSVKGHFKMDTREKKLKAKPEAKPEGKEKPPSSVPKALADAIGRVVDRVIMASEGQAFAAGEKTAREAGQSAAASADKDFQERQKKAKEAGAKADQGEAKPAKAAK